MKKERSANLVVARLVAAILALWALSFGLFPDGVAQAAPGSVAAKKWIDIVQDASVATALQRAEPAQRAQMEKAIQVANAFLHLHYSDNAYSFDPGYEDWSRETGPLVAMSGEEFEARMRASTEDHEMQHALVKDEPNAKQLRAGWIVCSTVHLTGVDSVATDTRVRYEAQRIGYRIYKYADGRFVVPPKPDKELVVIVVNSAGRVTDVKPFGSGTAPYRSFRAGREFFLKQPLKDIGGIGDTREIKLNWKTLARQELRVVDKAHEQFCHSDRK